MEVTLHREFPHPATRVWRVLRDFANPLWLSPLFPRIEIRGEGIGMQRLMYPTADSTPAIHQLDTLDDHNMHTRWAILRTHYLPVTDLTLTLGVVAIDTQRCHTTAHWCFSEPEDAHDCSLPSVMEALTMAISDKLQLYLERGHHK